MKEQKIWVVSVDGEVKKEGFTALSGACKEFGISYSTATKGERVFKVKGIIVRIFEVVVVRIKGREKNNDLQKLRNKRV